MSAEPVASSPIEAVAAPAVEETKPVDPAPAAEVVEASEDASAPKAEEAPVAPADESAAAAEEPKTDDTVATSADETKVDDKKEKKSAKALSGLLAKFRKPTKDDKATEKEVASPASVPEESAVTDAAPVVDVNESATGPALPVADAAANEETPVAAAAEAAPEATKTGATTPTKKERAGIFDRLTFFKKSPRSKKSELSPDASKTEETTAEASHPPAEASGDTAASTDDAKVTDTAAADSPVAPADTAAHVDDATKEDTGAHKKPKDLTKLARRLSGRLFGAERKTDKHVKAGETTKEEEEPSASTAPEPKADETVAAAAVPDVAAPVQESTPNAGIVNEEASLVPHVENTIETAPAITATA